MINIAAIIKKPTSLVGYRRVTFGVRRYKRGRVNSRENVGFRASLGTPTYEIEYEHAIKSPIADMKNSGGRPAGTCVAATILKHFVGDVPWLHLDIAGMDLEHRGTEDTPKGASGYGVRLLTEVLRGLA